MNILHRVLMIRLSRLFREGMTEVELYEATRGVWKLGSRREGVQYVLAIAGGVVREVYAVDAWHPAGSSPYSTRPAADLQRPGRWEFTGTVAPEAVRRLYLGGRVDEFFRKGAQTPVRYVDP